MPEQRVLLAEEAVLGQQTRALLQLCAQSLLVDCLHLVLRLLAVVYADDVAFMPHALHEEVHKIAHLQVRINAAFHIFLLEGRPPLLELFFFLSSEAGCDLLHDIANEFGLAEGLVVEVFAAERAGGFVLECLLETGQAEGVATVGDDWVDHEFQAHWAVKLLWPCDSDVLLTAEIHLPSSLRLSFLPLHPPDHSLPQLLPADTGPCHNRPLLSGCGLQFQSREGQWCLPAGLHHSCCK